MQITIPYHIFFEITMAAFADSPFLSLAASPVFDTKAPATVTVEETEDSTSGSIGVDSEQGQVKSNPEISTYGSNDQSYKYFTPFISERSVDEARPLKVIYIGAGISGILAAIKFRQAVPNLDLTIYEKNSELGGTWFENKYPGCACGAIYNAFCANFLNIC